MILYVTTFIMLKHTLMNIIPHRYTCVHMHIRAVKKNGMCGMMKCQRFQNSINQGKNATISGKDKDNI